MSKECVRFIVSSCEWYILLNRQMESCQSSCLALTDVTQNQNNQVGWLIQNTVCNVTPIFTLYIDVFLNYRLLLY